MHFDLSSIHVVQHREWSLKHFWEGRFKLHVFFLVGMVEAELVSMQAQASKRVVTIAIFGVANYGMPDVGHVDTNLVLATCFQLQFDQGISRVGV